MSSSSSGVFVANPCKTDADCAGATSCQVVVDAAMNALEQRCEPIVGANGVGVACTQGSTCRSGLCVEGFCTASCQAPTDCTVNGTCKQETVSLGGLSGNFPLCVIEPCPNSKACDPGEVCSAIQTSGADTVAYCRQQIAGGAAVGSTCANSTTCASGLCPSWLLACTEACGGDADCSATANEICVDMFGGGAGSIVEGCAPGCSRAGDCGTGKTCVIATDTKGDRDRFMCAPALGTQPTGTDCSTTNDCATGLCLSNTVNGALVDQICTQPCLTSADCPAGYKSCTDSTIATPSGAGTQTLRVCDHP